MPCLFSDQLNLPKLNPVTEGRFQQELVKLAETAEFNGTAIDGRGAGVVLTGIYIWPEMVRAGCALEMTSLWQAYAMESLEWRRVARLVPIQNKRSRCGI